MVYALIETGHIMIACGPRVMCRIWLISLHFIRIIIQYITNLEISAA